MNDRFLSGAELYGEDLSRSEIEAWFEDEREGYYGLEPRTEYIYGYSALNEHHGFRFLPRRNFRHVLGIGSAMGHELAPIQAQRVTVLEPASGFQNPSYEYVVPNPSGLMPFGDASFDFVSCLGVLHHVPNVSAVIREIFRVLEPGGYAFIREPVISMGDWRKPRRGLTKHERGIPHHLLHKFIAQAGFHVLRERKCVFSLTSRLQTVLRKPVYNSTVAVRLDSLLANLPIWSRAYHPSFWLQKLRPTAVFFVLRKTESD